MMSELSIDRVKIGRAREPVNRVQFDVHFKRPAQVKFALKMLNRQSRLKSALVGQVVGYNQRKMLVRPSLFPRNMVSPEVNHNTPVLKVVIVDLSKGLITIPCYNVESFHSVFSLPPYVYKGVNFHPSLVGVTSKAYHKDC